MVHIIIIYWSTPNISSQKREQNNRNTKKFHHWKRKIYKLKIENLDENFSFQTELSKLEREVLITLPNPKYNKMKETFDHLERIQINEKDTKPELPIHVILGTTNYVKISMQVSESR